MNLKLIDLTRLKNDFRQRRIISKKQKKQAKSLLELKFSQAKSVDVSRNSRNSWPRKLTQTKNHLSEIGMFCQF